MRGRALPQASLCGPAGRRLGTCHWLPLFGLAARRLGTCHWLPLFGRAAPKRAAGLRRAWHWRLLFALAAPGLALAQAADDPEPATTQVREAQPEPAVTEAAAAQASPAAQAAEATQPASEPPATVAELLRLVRQEAENAAGRNAARLTRFQQNRDSRRQMLEEVRRQVAGEDRRSLALGSRFEQNERDLQELQERLNVRIGNFGELFGVVRQVAGDAKGVVDGSLISAQRPGRGERAGNIAQARELPGLKELKALQILLLEEMAGSAEVVRFDGQITDPSGALRSGEVVRVGAFNLVQDGSYLSFEPESGALQMLPRQPSGRFQALAKELQATELGPAAVAVDPTRGQLLGLLIQTPDLTERIRQGGYVGYAIILMGLTGLLIALWRLAVLLRARRSVHRQLGQEQADAGNPLGRILAAYEQNRGMELEALSLKLDEAIMRETPALERWQGIIKVFAALAPLLGLLGTVVGMILTFQQLTLFGTGDPKLMAGGISQALMTTVLGLLVAIPLVLLHSLVSSLSRNLVEILEERSLGLVARRAAAGGG